MVSKYKTIFSLRLHSLLQKQGFQALYERDNKTNPEFKCWIYENTPAFAKAFAQLMKEDNYER